MGDDILEDTHLLTLRLMAGGCSCRVEKAEEVEGTLNVRLKEIKGALESLALS
jgi:hypothetical protein